MNVNQHQYNSNQMSGVPSLPEEEGERTLYQGYTVTGMSKPVFHRVNEDGFDTASATTLQQRKLSKQAADRIQQLSDAGYSKQQVDVIRSLYNQQRLSSDELNALQHAGAGMISFDPELVGSPRKVDLLHMAIACYRLLRLNPELATSLHSQPIDDQASKNFDLRGFQSIDQIFQINQALRKIYEKYQREYSEFISDDLKSTGSDATDRQQIEQIQQIKQKLLDDIMSGETRLLKSVALNLGRDVFSGDLNYLVFDDTLEDMRRSLRLRMLDLQCFTSFVSECCQQTLISRLDNKNIDHVIELSPKLMTLVQAIAYLRLSDGQIPKLSPDDVSGLMKKSTCADRAFFDQKNASKIINRILRCYLDIHTKSPGISSVSASDVFCFKVGDSHFMTSYVMNYGAIKKLLPGSAVSRALLNSHGFRQTSVDPYFSGFKLYLDSAGRMAQLSHSLCQEHDRIDKLLISSPVRVPNISAQWLASVFARTGMSYNFCGISPQISSLACEGCEYRIPLPRYDCAKENRTMEGWEAFVRRSSALRGANPRDFSSLQEWTAASADYLLERIREHFTHDHCSFIQPTDLEKFEYEVDELVAQKARGGTCVLADEQPV